jgi:hypothetical protein
MAGFLFDYTEGYLRVRFSPEAWGDFRVDFHFHGDGVVKTACDDQFIKGDSEYSLARDVHVSALTSDTTASFFSDMLAWLEAVTCGVCECAFVWEAEGPEGSLRWFRNHDGRGRLFLTWDGLRGQEPVSHKVLLNREQMVRAFYQAFLDLIGSPDYCPLMHEPITFGECIGYVLDEEDQARLASALALRGREDAYTLVSEILNFGYNQVVGSPQRTSLASLSELTAGRSVDPAHVDAWFNPEWDKWDSERRLACVEGLYSGGTWYSPGVKLSKMRSPLVEAWLEKPRAAGAMKSR